MFKRITSAALALVLMVGLIAGMPLRVHAVTQMSPSDEVVEFIKQIEGFHAIPYWDVKQWTVGFGTKCPSAELETYLETGIPLEEAEHLLADAMVYFGGEVNRFMKRNDLQLTQQQFDALFSLSYNLGPAWMMDTSNRLVKAVLEGKADNEIVYLMGLRCNAGGSFLQGLLDRRIMEADIYLNGRYQNKVHSDYGLVFYDAAEGKCEAKGQGYDMNLPATPLAVPTYDGYKFLGWYTAKTGGVRITQLDQSTDGLTLYAHWEKIGAADDITTKVENVSVKVLAYSLYVRSGPGVGYSAVGSVSKGDAVTITAVAEQNGSLWGKCSKGWISLDYTDYRPAQQPDEDGGRLTFPMNATVINPNGTAIHHGPHHTYPKIGTVAGWKQVRVLEVKVLLGQTWAKIDQGWVRLDRDVLLHDSAALTHFTDVTITNLSLNVRTGPGTTYSLAGAVKKGDQVKIVAVERVDGALWGRSAQGWISLQYTNFNEGMLPRYQNHTYEQWYDVAAASCTQEGQQRRDCVDCDHYETKVSQVAQHQFGDWYEVSAPDYDKQGLERRDCAKCGFSEVRETGVAQQPEIHIYGTVTGCEALNIRSNAGAGNSLVGMLHKGDRVEILEQKTVGEKVWGRTEKGWICITGYVTVEVTAQQPEQPQQPEAPKEKVYGTLTGYYMLNIRENAGTQYALVGTLQEGDRVEILEQKTVDAKTWGRIDKGWICLTGYMTLETVTEETPEQTPEEKPEEPEKLIMTVTASSLTIRSGAGAQYNAVGYLYGGTQVEVLEQKTVADKTWARISRGWVSMKYLK